MGNSNSVKLNEFNDQLISSVLWTLRHDEIIDYYHTTHNINNNSYQSLYECGQCKTEDIPYIYKNTISNNCYKLKTNWDKYNMFDDPVKKRSDMVNEYLYHILSDKNNIDKLLNQLVTKLQRPVLADSVSNNFTLAIEDKINDYITEDETPDDTTTPSYNNLLSNHDKSN